MKPRSSILDRLSLLLLVSGAVVGYNNGLARTPQMGWNTWNRFGCDIDEDLILESAKVVAEKFAVFGYEYIVMDDCLCSCVPRLSIFKTVF